MPIHSSIKARVVADYGAEYLVDDGASTWRAHARRCDPAVGDWVVLDGVFITEVLPRRTVFARRAAGDENVQQVLAANVDVVFVVAAATDVNTRRLERYLTIAWQSGATPVVVLTKTDLVEEVQPPAVAAPVIATSTVSGEGIEAIERELQPAKTAVMLGPSGVGKSTLINALVGTEVMRTREVHGASGEGRHMTSHRQLLSLPCGGAIIDTPGLREAQLWEGEDALGEVFEDIEKLALECRFNDCAHQTEPGCAIKAALAGGTLDAGRFASYRKLQREVRAIALRSDARLRIEDRKKWKRLITDARSRARP